MSTSSASIHEKAIFRVVDRIKWYPILQSASRAPVLLYHVVYGFEFNPVYSANRTSYVWGIIAIWCYLIAPIGFFFVYLLFYPKAKELIYQKLGLPQRLIDNNRFSSGSKPITPVSNITSSVGKGAPPNIPSTASTDSECVENDDVYDVGGIGGDWKLALNVGNKRGSSKRSSTMGPLSEGMDVLPDDPSVIGIGDSDADLLFLINSSHHARGLIDAAGGSESDIPMILRPSSSKRPWSVGLGKGPMQDKEEEEGGST